MMIEGERPLSADGPALRFGCTVCGRCCHDLRLPLSVREAILWLERGGDVELLCDAAPALPHPPGSPEAWRAERAVPASSGDLPVSIGVTLTAAFSGPCPNLKPDMFCAAYDVRPDVCRIYPAEVRPERQVDPAAKLCPPAAWDDTQPPFLDQAGAVVDRTTAQAIASTRRNGPGDVAAKARLLALLAIDAAALANEGFVIWQPAQDDLLAALRRADQDVAEAPRLDIAIVSGRAETCAMIREAGARDLQPDPARFAYLPLYA